VPLLRLDALHPELLRPLDLTLPGGECAAVHGPSGSGKTLLLRAVADLDPNRGEAWLDDQARGAMPATTWRRRVGYLPAESHWWTDQVAAHVPEWDRGLLERFGFGPDVLSWSINRLSSGERQRLALVRLLSRRPEALLLDEPSANLDRDNTLRLESVVADYRRDRLAPVLWVSHDREQRVRVATRCLRIEAGTLVEEPACR
jgi:ABC-type iron transport system FetAB ATPase subunit